MEEAKRVSVHLAASHSAAFLPACFTSLDAQRDQDFQVLAVEGGSFDEAGSWLREHRPDVIVMRSFRSPSFARSHEQALIMAFSRWPVKLYRDRYILFLRPDVILPPEAIERLVRTMAADLDLVAVGPTVYLAIPQPTEEGEQEEIDYSETMLSSGYVMRRTRSWFRRQSGQDALPIFSPPTECLLVRASALHAARSGEGYVDVDLHEPGALLDLIWRLRLLGGKVKTLQSVRVWRRGGALLMGRGTKAEQQEMLADAFVMSAKNDFTSNRWFHGPWIWIQWLRFIGLPCIHPSTWIVARTVFGARFRSAKGRAGFLSRVTVRPHMTRTWFV